VLYCTRHKRKYMPYWLGKLDFMTFRQAHALWMQELYKHKPIYAQGYFIPIEPC
jgi:hypothetical protein